MNHEGRTRPSGNVANIVVRDLGSLKPAPRRWTIQNFLRYRLRSVPKDYGIKLIGQLAGVATVGASLTAFHYRRPQFDSLEMTDKLRRLLNQNVDVRELCRHFGGVVTNYGIVSTRLVTDAGVAYLVDSLQNLTEPENFKYHGYGTGTTAEAANQTALVTELTTQYVVDSTRPTGSQTENAANIYRTVGTLSPDSGGTIAVTEHGIFSAASAGTMLDRSVFSAINLVAGSDSLQTTYDFTITSGG